jgi:hypothetical protein
MAFSLTLPPPLPAQGWKVKIRDQERNEPPHVTIIRKKQWWRFDLRSRAFLDRDPDPKEVPAEVLAEIEKQIDVLRREWDEMYPENPIDSKDDGDE